MSNYRIVRLTAVQYPQTIAASIEAARAAGEVTYRAVLDSFFANGAVYGDGFSRGMRALGNDAHDILHNAVALQHLWAEENGFAYDPEDRIYQIATAQIAALKPDVVFVQGVSDDPLRHIVQRADFRERCPSVRVVVGYVGFPTTPEALAPYDFVLSGTPMMWMDHRQAGAEAHLLYHAFDTRVLDSLAVWRSAAGPRPPGPACAFVGSTGFSYGAGHTSRFWDLVYLVLTTDIQVWAHEPLERLRADPEDVQRVADWLRRVDTDPKTTLTNLARLHNRSFGTIEPLLPLSKLFPERCHPPVYGVEMYDLLTRAGIVYNRHTDFAVGCVGNMRLFEATGVGACLLTDDGMNLTDLFEPDSEVVVYSSVDECVEKIRWLSEHPEQRRRIAEAGQRRTLRDHTTERRVEVIDELIRRHL